MINHLVKNTIKKKEDLKDKIDSVANDITKQEFDYIVNKYYETFDINEQEPFEPTNEINVNDERHFKTNEDYKKKLIKNPPNSLVSTYSHDFFNIIPFSFWSSNLPKELISKYDKEPALNFKIEVF